MTTFRLRHTSVTRFPRCGSLVACLALCPTPPGRTGPVGVRTRTGRHAVFPHPALLSYRQLHVPSQAPSLHRHYPASSLLWTCPIPEGLVPTRPILGYVFPKNGGISSLPVGLPRFLCIGSSTDLSVRAALNHPGEPDNCLGGVVAGEELTTPPPSCLLLHRQF